MSKPSTTRYFITLGKGEPAEPVDVLPVGERELQVSWRDQTWTVDALGLADGSMSLLAGNRSYSLDLEEKGEALQISLGDAKTRLEIVDERSHRLQGVARRNTVEGRQTVSAPMPGKVVRLMVKPGDEVKEGQGLVIVEAMKMENELKSPKAGKVEEIAVREGQTVEGGTKLVIVA